MQYSPKGIAYPNPGDDLIEIQRENAYKIGSIFHASDLLSAQTLLDDLDRDMPGMITPETPAYIEVYGNIYVVTSRRSHPTMWVLMPVNFTELWEDSWPMPREKQTLAWKAWTGRNIWSLGVAPFPRIIEVQATMWANVTGQVDMCVSMGPGETDMVASRFPTGSVSQQAFNSMKVPAGVDASVWVYARGGGGGGTVQMDTDEHWNKALVKAYPDIVL